MKKLLVLFIVLYCYLSDAQNYVYDLYNFFGGSEVENYPLKLGINNFEILTIDWAKGIYICNLMLEGKVMKSEKMVIE